MFALRRAPTGVLRALSRGLALPPHQVLGLPALSPTMTQGNISKYLVKVGDTVNAGVPPAFAHAQALALTSRA